MYNAFRKDAKSLPLLCMFIEMCGLRFFNCWFLQTTSPSAETVHYDLG